MLFCVSPVHALGRGWRVNIRAPARAPMFCKCGSIIKIPKREIAICRTCGRKVKMVHQEVVFEKRYRDAADTVPEEPIFAPTINQACPECGAEEMRYNAIQTRSADEGQTIFYYCACGYTMKVNS